MSRSSTLRGLPICDLRKTLGPRNLSEYAVKSNVSTSKTEERTGNQFGTLPWFHSTPRSSPGSWAEPSVCRTNMEGQARVRGSLAAPSWRVVASVLRDLFIRREHGNRHFDQPSHAQLRPNQSFQEFHRRRMGGVFDRSDIRESQSCRYA